MKATGDRQQTACKNLAALLVELGQSCTTLRDMVLEKLVNAVCSYSTLLADTPLFTALDVNAYEIMYFICDALAQLFTSTQKRWPYGKLGVVAKQLDEKMMSISSRYPMFAREMWLLSTRMMDSLKEVKKVKFPSIGGRIRKKGNPKKEKAVKFARTILLPKALR